MPLRLLVIEDRQSDFEMLEEQLRRQGLDAWCRRVDTVEDLTDALEDPSWDAVLTDYNVPGMGFQSSVALVRGRRPALPIVLFSGYMGEDQAAELLKAGITDFVLKYRPARLGSAIRRAVDEAHEQQARRAAEAALLVNEVRLRLALDGAELGMLRFDWATGMFHLDARAQLQFGLGAAVPFAALRAHVHPDDVQAIDAALGQAADPDADGRYALEFRVRLPDGGERWLLSRGRVHFGLDGASRTPLERIGIVQDITGRKHGEAAQQLSRRSGERERGARRPAARRR